MIAAFEQSTGKTVELALHPQNELPAKVLASIEAGRPPDFLFGSRTSPYNGEWMREGRLVDLSDTFGPLADLFFPDAFDRVTLIDATGRRSLYGLPIGHGTNHVHVWRSLLERAGFTLADIPKQWEPFWSFWCDQVQPAVRKALGRDDVWGVGLPVSAAAIDTNIQFWQFVAAYEAEYVTRDGRLVIDEPTIRDRLIKVLDSYTAIYRKGCTPPGSSDWDGSGNNKAFVDQAVMMTPNVTLSITNTLQDTRPGDYYKNVATIEWPSGAYGQPLAIFFGSDEGVVFQAGGHIATAKEFVRFLVEGGWLAHWLDFARDRLLPPMPALLERPFWLDPGDPHRMAAAIQFLTRPRRYSYATVSGEWRHGRVEAELVWAKAIHRTVTAGLSSEQAVDEAIERVKQILSE
jgi:multiple sugar transport system substrate-binding protein